MTNSLYTWTGISLAGKRCRGVISAPTLALAQEKLSQQKLVITTLKKKLRFTFQSESRKLTLKSSAIFFDKLHSLIKNGIPTSQALTLLSESFSHTKQRHMINNLLQSLNEGKCLSTALLQSPTRFDDLTCYLIQVGEETGNLDKILKGIANQKLNYLKQKNKFYHALTYPIVLVLFCMLITLFMCFYIIPHFEILFDNYQAKLPASTGYVLFFAKCVRKYLLIFILCVSSLIFLFCYIKKLKSVKDKLHLIIFKVPVLGEIYKKIILVKFARTLSLILFSGVPLHRGLVLSENLDKNTLYQQQIREINSKIQRGQRLDKSLNESPFFPQYFIQMVKVGEETGTLDLTLEKIALHYESDLDDTILYVTNLLEPLIIIIVGVLIGGIVIAMYLPIFKLGTII